MYSALGNIHKRAIAQLQAVKTNRDIIWYELANHETQISGDLTSVYETLEDYPGITKQMILYEYRGGYYQYCIDNDYF